MSEDDKTVRLEILIGTLLDSMQIITAIAKEKVLTEELLMKCELATSQFKEEFSEELLEMYY